MLNTQPCFRWKYVRANGESFELEIRASLLRWMVIGSLAAALVLRGGDPVALLTRLIPRLIGH